MKSDSTAFLSHSAAFEERQPTSIRVILADSQAIYRVGMRKVFDLEDDIRVVAQAETLDDLYTEMRRSPADVVVVEGELIADMPDAVQKFTELLPGAGLVVQVAAADADTTVQLYRQGARGVVPRSISPDLLVKCMRKTAAGETWIDDRSVKWLIETCRAQTEALMRPRTQPKLTPKELVITGWIARGLRNKEIASQVGTTEQVVKNYLRKIYDKLGVSDRLELALYCLHHEILKSHASNPDSPPI